MCEQASGPLRANAGETLENEQLAWLSRSENLIDPLHAPDSEYHAIGTHAKTRFSRSENLTHP